MKAIDHPLWQPEFEDILKVLEFGANKYAPNNWLEADAEKTSFQDIHASMRNHLDRSQFHGLSCWGDDKGCRADYESNLDPLLHLATRALMMYTRMKRGTKHKEDAVYC